MNENVIKMARLTVKELDDLKDMVYVKTEYPKPVQEIIDFIDKQIERRYEELLDKINEFIHIVGGQTEIERELSAYKRDIEGLCRRKANLIKNSFCTFIYKKEETVEPCEVCSNAGLYDNNQEIKPQGNVVGGKE